MVMKSSCSVEMRSFRSRRKYTTIEPRASTMDGSSMVWMFDQKSCVERHVGRRAREDVPVHGEEQHEDRRDHEGRQRQHGEGRAVGRLVEQPVGPPRRVHGHGEGDGEGEDLGEDDQLEVDGERLRR